MAKTREQKQAILENLNNAFKSATSVVFVHFNGLNVAQESGMRRKLREDGITYTVAKKSLIAKAFDGVGTSGDLPVLDGEIAIAYSTDSEDPTLPARRVHEFGTEFKKDKLSIVGGVFESSFRDAAGMQEIATIPSIDVLRGMFVNVINSPIQGLAVALNAIAEKKA
jgi:large subunit ribosomal protein L10